MIFELEIDCKVNFRVLTTKVSKLVGKPIIAKNVIEIGFEGWMASFNMQQYNINFLIEENVV